MSTREDELMDAKQVNELGECPDCHYIECSCKCEHGQPLGDCGTCDLQQALTMHADELKSLSEEAGRVLTEYQAHQFRLRKLMEELIARMLDGKDKEPL